MQEKQAALTEILEQYQSKDGALIPILQKTQDLLGYLSEDAMDTIASALNLSKAEVYGVATFYTQFRFTPIGKFTIKVCHGTACHVGGANIIDSTLESQLGIQAGETTSDGLFTILPVACLGCCSLAPVIMINDKTYGKLNSEKLIKVIDDCRKVGEQNG